MQIDSPLSEAETSAVNNGLELHRDGKLNFADLGSVQNTLAGLLGFSLDQINEARASYSPSPRLWLISWTEEFQKSLLDIDRKLQGRVLVALGELSREPIKPQGNTIKPLSSGLKGLWRYRIGGFRLIYFPDSDNKQVVVLSFSNRGNAYE
jgi:mRNA-degrading endonuclease RelE of RelBE toxin-antitoxin system